MGKQAVILAGGRATRLGAIARDTPKPLLRLGGRPFIAHLIEDLSRFGFDHITILVGAFRDAFEAALQGAPKSGARVELVSEPEPAGTAGALMYAAPRLRQRFLLVNGDSFFDVNLLDLATRRSRRPWIARVALRQIADTGRYGAVRLDGTNIVEFGEKSGSGPGLINAGIYWLKRDILDEIGTPPCSLETDVLPRLASRGLVQGRVFQGNFIDIGTPEDFRRGRDLLADWRRRPAAFLDRDGVLNRDHGYVYRSEEFEWIAGAKQAVKLLNDRGYWVFVVTNQAGVARGYYQVADVERLHRWMNAELRRSGAHIDGFYYCPHHPDVADEIYGGACDCRKPEPGMLLNAMKDWPIDHSRSFLIGDKSSDLLAAQRAGIAGHLFDSGDLCDNIRRVIENPAEPPTRAH
jgi:D,D-heptose 1,7-bisphosphate phosphatase